MKVAVKLKKLHELAVIPEYKTSGAAGADIHTIERISIGPGGVLMVRTGLAVEIPNGWEIQLRSRSGMAKVGIVVANSPATIDSDFRGEILVLLKNTHHLQHTIDIGIRIAQLVLAPVSQATWVLTEELSSTERGTGGFGSTGVR